MATEAEKLRNSQELEASQLRINQLRQEEAQYARDSSAAGQQQLRVIQEQLRNERTLLNTRRESLQNEQTFNKEFASFAKSYTKLSSVVKNQLQTQSSINSSLSVYKALSEDIAKSKAREGELTGDALLEEQERSALLNEINSSLLEQAKATAKEIDNASGLTEFDKMRRELKETMLELSDDERKKAEEAINQTEILYNKEQRLASIKEEQKGLYEAMPESLRSGVDFAKKLGGALKTGALPMVLLASLALAAFKSFSDLDSAAKEFRETTGMTNSQMTGIKSDVNEIVGDFGHLGVNAKSVFDTVAALKSEFSDVADFSQETTAALTVLSTNFGVSAENAAKVQGVLEQVSGLSSETAASVQLQVADMAKMAGVAPAKVMADIAESAEIASTLFKGDTTALAKNAIEARRLGTNLKSVAATAEKLLDFEGGIEEELTAATYVGGQFNLSRARALAFEGKIVDAQKETLSQIQRSGDFRKKDYFTQQQLAKAAGMSVEEINKQLNAQEKLNSLSDEQKKMAEDAINAGLDISNISEDQLASQVQQFSIQQEQQAALEKLQNAFTGIASTVGSALTPLLDAIIPIIQAILYPVQLIGQAISFIVKGFSAMAPVLLPILGIMNALWLKTQALAIISVIKGAWQSLGGLPVVGPALALAAIAGGIGYIKSQKAGDMYSPADGKTQVSTKEGGLFELSPNDDLIAAPGAADAMSGKGGGGINLSALAAPMQAMVNEVKALRADLAAGKIAVYMDAQKVTNGVSTVVDQSTRNSYNLGTV